ncbi:MAG: hypothetical protein JWP36_2277, partial [Paucimonas sp.]|nr:hypothetical protein [Paucimonas sp.]
MDYAVTPFARTSNEPTTSATPSTTTTNSTQDPALNKSSTEPAMTTPSRTSVYSVASVPSPPNELLLDILSRLRLNDLFSLCLVSKGMRPASELAMLRVQRADAGTRAMGSRIANAVLQKAWFKLYSEKGDAIVAVDFLENEAQQVLRASLAPATEEAIRAFSSVGRRYMEIPVCLFPGFPKKAGSALIQADGWSHLKLSGFNRQTLGAFLSELIATRGGVNQRPRKVSIDMVDFEAGSVASAIAQIEALSRCAPQLTLSGLRLSTFFIDELKNVIAAGKSIEELHIDIQTGHMGRAENFIGNLARLKNLKVLELNLQGACGPISQPLVKQIAALQMDTLSLFNHDG